MPKNDFDQGTVCGAAVLWSKYTIERGQKDNSSLEETTFKNVSQDWPNKMVLVKKFATQISTLFNQ